jgi:menaquinone-dependent protoporphyrinogen oxidase
MKVLVAYASRHGATEGIAERIGTTLADAGLDVTFRSVEDVDAIGDFDAVVVGSSAYMGHWEKSATEFVRRHEGLLATKPVWLFSSGPVGTETHDNQGRDVLDASRPREFSDFAEVIHPRGEQVFFGAYDPDRKDATIGERLVSRFPAIHDLLPKGDFRDWPTIEAWATGIARELTPAVAAV